MLIGSFAIPVQDPITADFWKEASETSENWKGKNIRLNFHQPILILSLWGSI